MNLKDEMLCAAYHLIFFVGDRQIYDASRDLLLSSQYSV